MPSRTNTLTIKTPEGVAFSLTLADPVTRFLAWLLDFMAVSVLAQLTETLFTALGLVSEDLARAAIILAYFVISIGYGMALEWFWRGQTLGKRLLRLRVMDVHGLKLTFSQIVIRNLLRFIDSQPGLYMVGGLCCLLTRRGQRLGDLAANTIVIRHPRIVQPDLDQLLAGKYNSLHDYPHIEARLRQRVSPAEARVALQALMRRDQLNPEARVQLFHEVADYFKALVPFPAEAVEGLSDEHYVRNVVESLFRAGKGGK